MKLLLDENLPRSLCKPLGEHFPGSSHVAMVGLASSDDQAVWDYALRHDFTLVSKDADFNQLGFVRGAPPKVVWVRVGNCSVDDIRTLLLNSVDVIRDFIARAEATVLVLGRTPPTRAS